MRHLLRNILLELVGGILLGSLFLAAGSLLGSLAGSGASSGWGDVITALFGSVVAYPLGFVLGMWIVALLLREPYSLWKAFLAAAAGLAAILLLAQPLHLNEDPRILGTLLYLVPSVCAFLGSRWIGPSRRGQSPASR